MKIKTKFNIGDLVRYKHNNTDPIWRIYNIKIFKEGHEVKIGYGCLGATQEAHCGCIEEEALERV